MNGVNHITGGIVFTGVFTSLWDVNLFSQPEYLAVCSVASILPDIDHRRSPIGKAFYPIAQYLDRHYGHRTITHSLIFLLGSTLAFFLLASLFSDASTLTMVYVFALSSHLIFDMMTVQGVPLFYPFYPDPWWPGNIPL